MNQRTLAIIKPDAVKRHFIGHVISTLELHEFKIIDMKMMHMTKEEAEEYHEFNQVSAYVGEATPIFVRKVTHG